MKRGHNINKQTHFDVLMSIWNKLYPNQEDKAVLFLEELTEKKETLLEYTPSPLWYKDAIVYSLYVDLYNNSFDGLIEKLPYLSDLGVNTLWLLPVLESPMRDAGFDISRHDCVRASLLNMPEDSIPQQRQEKFKEFIDDIHRNGFHIIFDIALNHTSDQHPWFLDAKKGATSPCRDYYIWGKDENGYSQARIIFKGMINSNWQKEGDEYFFHRFFPFQPDINYKNPQVLIEISRILMFWISQGIDGIRADAIPYLWKKEGTNCENLPETHLILQFFRAIINFLSPNTLLLAEACQQPKEVVKYFGDNNECQAGYHFPLMPQIFKALAIEKSFPILDVLSFDTTPEIDNNNQWFTFLRVHDELTLEMVTPEDRELLFNHYAKNPLWNFRKGEGISSRLSELLDLNPHKYVLAFAIMLSLPGTPLIYYGDEWGKTNDYDYYEKQCKLSGYYDSRALARGPIPWTKIQQLFQEKHPFHHTVFESIKKMLHIRNQTQVFGRGTLSWITPLDENNKKNEHILAFKRTYLSTQILVILNLSSSAQNIKLDPCFFSTINRDMLNNQIDFSENTIRTNAYGFHWFLMK